MEETAYNHGAKDRSHSADSRRSSASSTGSFYTRNNQRMSIVSQRLPQMKNNNGEVNIIDLTSDDEIPPQIMRKDSDSAKSSEEQSSNKTRRMSELVNRKRKSIFSFGSDLIHGGILKDNHSKTVSKENSVDDEDERSFPHSDTNSSPGSISRRFSLKGNRFPKIYKNKSPRNSLPNIPYESPNANENQNLDKNSSALINDCSNSHNLIHAKPFDLFCKVLLLGDPGVGKTCLLLKYKDGAFLSGSYISTVGIDFRNKVINLDDSTVKLQIWDTAGQERFRSVTHAYYRDAHALLLLYDVMNKASFDNTRGWLAEVKEYAQDDVVIMLIGNKCDIPASERQIRREDGERLAREYSVAFMETSAKTGLNVDLAFTAIAKDLKARKSSNALEKKFNVAEYVEKQERIDHCTCSLI